MPRNSQQHLTFPRFKYGIYLLLGLNILLFLWEEWQAAAQVLSGDAGASEVVSAFSATIDTAAWVGLLLLFELETWQIPPERIRGRLQWTLHGVRGFLYLFVLYAFYGYSVQCYQLYQVQLLDVVNACALAGDAVSFQVRLDEFIPVTAAACTDLPSSGGLWRIEGYGTPVVTDGNSLQAAQRLAWTDVINAGTWITLVMLLEFDVRLKRRGGLRGAVRRLLQAATTAVYAVLLVCATYWWFAGTFLDFWDALLWLVAFAFIEMNIFGKAQSQPA